MTSLTGTLPANSERVERHTAAEVNRRLHREMEARLAQAEAR